VEEIERCHTSLQKSKGAQLGEAQICLMHGSGVSSKSEMRRGKGRFKKEGRKGQ